MEKFHSQQKKQKNKRLSILSPYEYEALYQFPHFNSMERQHYFDLSRTAKESMRYLPLQSAVYFILQWGYFNAKRQFFSIDFRSSNPYLKKDIQFVMQKYFPKQPVPKKIPSRRVQSQIKEKILARQGYEISTTVVKKAITEKTTLIVRSCADLSEIFREILQVAKEKKWMMPAYSTMQKIISHALIREDGRLQSLLKKTLPSEICYQLSALIKEDKTFYKLTELKQDLRNFNYKKIEAELNKQRENRSLYHFAKNLLPTLEISQKNIAYYSSLAYHYTPYKLRRLPEMKSFLYLLCYLYHRYQKMSDNITQAFLYHVDQYHNEAIAFADKRIAEEKKILEIDQEKLGRLVGLFTQKSWFHWPFRKVAKQAYKILPAYKIKKIQQTLMDSEQSREKRIWQYYSEKRHAIAMNLRPLFKAMQFEHKEEGSPLMRAVSCLQSVFHKNQSLKDNSYKLPLGFISRSSKPHIVPSPEKINLPAYEFAVYYRLRKHIGSYKIPLNDTLQFKSLQEDLKSTHDWEENHTAILKKLDNPKLDTPIKVRLAMLEEILQDLYQKVNKNIEKGQNDYIKITETEGKKTWTLAYPKEEDEFDPQFYRNLALVNFNDIFDFVNQQCDFMKVFTHLKPHQAKGKNDLLAIKACIIANATHQGINQMASRSNISLQSLKTHQANYLRLETLSQACNKLLRDIQKMPIFERYNYQVDIYHGSIDGSKHGTKRHTIKSRYSPKYFGLGKGVSALNFILNHLPVNATIIGANEHESHYGFQMCFYHDADIPIDVISTDTAGSNPLSFLLYDVVNIQYAPCYKSLMERAKNLCSFKPLSHYKNDLIKPTKKVNTELIFSEWDNMQQILAAFLMKETIPSVVVKKLSSHENQHKLKRALWEYNRILFSIYFLKYLDDPLLRRSVRIALNRGEGYNKFYNAIVKIGGKKFRGMSELEIEIWHQCTRLVSLVILYYNMHLLSCLREKKLAIKDEKAVKAIEKISPLAIRHIILGGTYYYEVSTEKVIDIEKIVSELNEALEKITRKRENRKR